jgi:putative ABC transport system ATP-binding protein
MFRLEKVNKIYKNQETEFQALHTISLEIADNEILAIMGASGSGKTTLLNVMSTIAEVSDGHIEYNGTALETLSQEEAAKLRLHKFGFVFQKYYLLPTLTVYDNICMPLILADREVDYEYLKELCEVLDITSQLDKMPNYLSGGQQQRVAIARALIMKPEVVFADEPTGNLDSINSQKVIRLLLECARKYNQSVIYVTHDMQLASLANRMITIRDGMVVC